MITANDIDGISYIGTNTENQRVYEIHASNEKEIYLAHLVLSTTLNHWTDEYSLTQGAKDFILEYISSTHI